ncbi:MAG: nucleotidyltransferase domain-containing protein [Treponema phagedenis]|uniref:nucleotidyltransferase domain-containing protein n=1 Tax=Treponema phagedenis TaxID=162 RepID=UPI0031341E15
MRISEQTKGLITEAVIQYMPQAEKIILFGSRADDTKRGGDIDLLVQTAGDSAVVFTQKVQAVSAMQLQLNGQRIDLVTARGEDDERLIVQTAYREGVVLWTK